MIQDERALRGTMTRRTMLKGSALAGFGAFLAACGTGGTESASPSAAGPESEAPTEASATPGASEP
ncbi:MAG TPA: hypothetical protein VLA44_03765, partial [Clostridia bacterium]|nr:hypothetical protein [Clostridia bacterium]